MAVSGALTKGIMPQGAQYFRFLRRERGKSRTGWRSAVISYPQATFGEASFGLSLSARAGQSDSEPRIIFAEESQANLGR